jgi:hypothetical protein
MWHDKDSEKESYCFYLSDAEPVTIVISFDLIHKQAIMAFIIVLRILFKVRSFLEITTSRFSLIMNCSVAYFLQTVPSFR